VRRRVVIRNTVHINMSVNAINIIGIRKETIVVDLIPDINGNQNKAGETDSKTGDVNNCVRFVLKKTAKGDL